MPDPMNAADYSDASDPNSALAQALMNHPNYLNPAYISPEMLADLRARGASYLKPPEAKSWTGAIGQTLGALASNRMAGQAAMLDQARGAERYKANNWLNNGGATAPSGNSGGAPTASAGGMDPQSLVSAYAPVLGQAGAAGLVGGGGAESGYSPTAVGDNGHAIGWLQWNDRAPTVQAYAAKYGRPVTDPEIQKRFPLVEMGLAGDPSDPGFGTERAAGKALQAARTPQEAAAAALMYERPKGYSAAHPENSMAYGKRLSLATALMGGQGGSGASPAAYADGGPSGSGMPPVGPGAGTQVPLASAGGGPGNGQMSAGAPAGPNVMAQNAAPSVAVPGGAPVQGSPAWARIMSNSSPEMDPVKRSLLLQDQPQTITDATGGVHVMRPNRAQGQQTPGNLSTTITPQGVGANQGTWNGQPIGPTIYPGGGGGQTPATGAPAAGGGGALPKDPQGWNEYWRKAKLLSDASDAMTQDALKIPQYRNALSVLNLADKAADNIEDPGPWTKIKAAVQTATGLEIGDNLSSMDTFRALVGNLQTMLPPGVAGISPEVLAKWETTPEGRHKIIANLKAMLQYGVDIGQVGGNTEAPTEEKWKRRQSIMPPQPLQPPPAQGGAPLAASGSGGSASAAPAKAPIPVSTPAEARKYPSGTLIKLPDGRVKVVP